MTPTPAAIRLSRHVLASWLQLQPMVDVDGVDDLLVACSELVTNAVSHASGADGSVSLRASVEGDGIRLEVEDDGVGFAWNPTGTVLDVDPDDEHGRGLFIVETLTDTLDVRVEADRTIVSAFKGGMLHTTGGEGHDPGLSARFRADC